MSGQSGQSGYTLVETLAALTVIALAMTGLSAGVQVFLREQANVNAATAQTQARRDAQLTLDRLLDRSAPYRAQEAAHFSGDGQSMRIDCAQANACTASLTAAAGGALLNVSADGAQRTWRLPASGRTHFIYVGTLDTGEVWPPASGRPQALQSLSVVDDGATPSLALLKTRVWAQQPAVCAFDPVSQDCR